MLLTLRLHYILSETRLCIHLHGLLGTVAYMGGDGNITSAMNSLSVSITSQLFMENILLIQN